MRRKPVDVGAIMRERWDRDAAINAARAAVVEAARDWRYAASDETEAPIALRRAVDALEALERDHA